MSFWLCELSFSVFVVVIVVIMLVVIDREKESRGFWELKKLDYLSH